MGNPLDDIVDELVVFKHEDPNHPQGLYFSNNPMWNDSRVRDHWMSRHSDEAKSQSDGAEDEDEVVEVEDYGQLTNDQLREELARRGLSVDGKKVELIQRLEEDDAKAETEE